jgi:Gamma-butyrobetaine hydroxylase-like, N-terminal
MAGLDPGTPAATALTLHQASRMLEVGFADGSVQGHGPGQEVLQTGKRQVLIEDLAAVGHYGVQPSFSDGHKTGIFSWDYLYFLGSRQVELWRQYEERLAAAGVERDTPMAVAAGSSCGHSH